MKASDPFADFTVIGAGIVGLSTAWKLQLRHPDCKIRVIEAENSVARHQSGHNSGVIHSGIYYRPGSEKASTCRRGKEELESFCQEHDVAWERCGKVIVATHAGELDALARIEERGKDNGVESHRLNTDELRKLEPNAAGIAAIHVPETGIVDYVSVCLRLCELIRKKGGKIEFSKRVTNVHSIGGAVQIECNRNQTYESGLMVNCAGLQCDRIAQMSGVQPEVQIVPFRGEYYELAKDRESLVQNLIYPVPDPAFPFLGVHFTRMVGGGVECGPNAVLALAREGYNWKTIRPRDLAGTLSFGGFRKFAAKHWKMGLGEMVRSLNKAAFVKALQKLMPRLRENDLIPGRSGVRAQAVRPNGELVDDFLIQPSEGAIHVLNAPSPAATASLAIASSIVDQVDQQTSRTVVV